MHIYFCLAVYLSTGYLYLAWWVVRPLGFHPWCLLNDSTLFSLGGSMVLQQENMIGEVFWGKATIYKLPSCQGCALDTESRHVCVRVLSWPFCCFPTSSFFLPNA